MQTSKTMSVSFNMDIFSRINDYCKARGCTRSWFINQAADMYLRSCLEDKADYEAAVDAWSGYERDGGNSSSAEEVFLKAGL